MKAYACYHKDLDVRMRSSSGGVFSLLAERILAQQGVVYGVAMTEDCYAAEFISVTDRKGMDRLRGSKYLQARVGDTFRKVQRDLKAGKAVLFTGTGCQVNGLKSFLGREYSNLLCVDMVCHGVPSPKLWESYVRDQEQKFAGKLKAVNFRAKDESWINFGMKKVLEGTREEISRERYTSKDDNSYMRMFLRDYCLRPSCYACSAKQKKLADMTIADFWGIDKVVPEMHDGRGTSLLIIRTDKGQDAFDRICEEMIWKEVSYEDGVRYNLAECQSCARPPQRDTFFDDLQAMSFAEMELKYAGEIKLPYIRRAKNLVKKCLKRLLHHGDGKIQ